MKRRILVLLLFLTLITSMLFIRVYADTRVTVNIPNFNIKLNGTQVDNTYRQYPFITYKGITYFPLTYYDCRYLGLETTWDNANGLAINKVQVSTPYNATLQNNKNNQTQVASIPSFKITVNNKIIDNSKEEYPLLLFRNVTYFPMTWKF